MELRELLRVVWFNRGAVALGLVVAAAASALTLYRIDLGVPPSAERRSLETGSASAQLLVDVPRSAIAEAGPPLEGLTARAGVLALVVESPRVVERIASGLGLGFDDIAVRGAPPAGTARGRQTSAEERSTEILTEEDRYRLVAAVEAEAPVISLFASAPTPWEATRLVETATHVLPAYMSEIQARREVPPAARLQIRHLGTPVAGWVNRGADYAIAGLAFLAGLLAWALILTALSRARQAMARQQVRVPWAGEASMPALSSRREEGTP